MRLGYLLGAQINYPKLGAVVGFMLLMGGWFVYWGVEFVRVQAQVNELCKKDSGITVFITPEEWRKQIGEEEWSTLNEDFKNFHHKLDFSFNGKIYHGVHQLNKRVFVYEADDERDDKILEGDVIYVDKNSKQVLFREHWFEVGVPAIANSLTGLKVWKNTIDDCSWKEWESNDRFFSNNYTNNLIKKGN